MKYVDVGLSAAVRIIKSDPLFNMALSMGYREFMDETDDGTMLRQRYLAKASIDLLEELTDDSYGLSKYIPRELYSRGRSGIGVFADDFPVFKNTLMLCENLISLNRECRSRWLNALSDCVRDLDYETREILSSFSDKGGWDIAISDQGGALCLSFGKMLWGSVRLSFSNGRLLNGWPPRGDIIACFTELEKCGDGTHMRILCTDRKGAESSAASRPANRTANPGKTVSVDKSSLLEIEIVCDSITAHTRYYDYGDYFFRRGGNYYDLLVSGSECIYEKYCLLGINLMSAEERRLLPSAKLTNIANVRKKNGVDFDYGGFDRIALFAFLDNRFEVDSLIDLLEEKYRFHELSDALKTVLDEYDEDERAACRKFAHVIHCYRMMNKGAIGYFFLQKFCRQLFELGKGNEKSPFCPDEQLESIFAPSVCLLESEGFTGQFPHFGRDSGKKCDFISFVRVDRPEIGDTDVSYSIKLASTAKSDFEMTMLGFDSAYAHDVEMLPKTKRSSAQLMDESDGLRLTLDRRRGRDQTGEKTDRLALCTRAAIAVLDGRRPEKNYLRRKSHAYSKSSVRVRDALNCCFIALCAACLFYIGLLLYGMGLTPVTMMITLASALVAYCASRLAVWIFRTRRIM